MLMPPRQSVRAIACLFTALALLLATAWGCSVPVFRYALEHWEADPYQGIVFHRGALTPAQRDQVKALEAGSGAAAYANLKVTTADVSLEMSPEVAALWKQQPQDANLPRFVLRFPRRSGNDSTIIATPLSEAAECHLSDSPARRQITESLGDGVSAVWVLIESGDAARDDAAAKLLEERLDYLMGVLTLPELDQLDIVNGLISVGQDELRLEFSMLRIPRTSSQERTFVSMLLNSEPDLATLSEPIVFPIFGRGRALYALAGKGIRAETIDRAATFLIGKCSCQVKDQNPGIDLLFSADWKAMAKASPLLERQLPSFSHLVQAAAPVAVTAQPQADVTARGIAVSPTMLVTFGAILAGVVLAGWMFARSRR